jgi:hypothetical protein
VLVALISTSRQPAVCAIRRAIVVFPVPDPPHSIIEGTRFSSMRPRSTPFGPMSSCPHTSSNEQGRIRSARGADRCIAFSFALFVDGALSSGEAPFVSCCVSRGRLELLYESFFDQIGVGAGWVGSAVLEEDADDRFEKNGLGLTDGLALVSSVRICSVQPESRCSFMRECLTLLPHMGQSTPAMMAIAMPNREICIDLDLVERTRTWHELL